jgi:hypothetical protein
MGHYRVIAPTLWTGPTGRQVVRLARELGPAIQILYPYLLTNGHSNAEGIYRLPTGYIAADLGLDIPDIETALAALSRIGFAHYNADPEIVWIVNMARDQIGALKPGDNRIVKAQRFYDHLPGNIFLADFFDRYAAALHLQTRRTPSPFEAPCQAPPKHQDLDLALDPDPKRKTRPNESLVIPTGDTDPNTTHDLSGKSMDPETPEDPEDLFALPPRDPMALAELQAEYVRLFPAHAMTIPPSVTDHFPQILADYQRDQILDAFAIAAKGTTKGQPARHFGFVRKVLEEKPKLAHMIARQAAAKAANNALLDNLDPTRETPQ